jgi:glucose/arabinose dehydrogenase
MMRTLRWIVATLLLALVGATMAQQPPAAFVTETLHSPANGKTGISFDHLGAVYLIEKQGRVIRAAANGSGGYETPVVFADFVTEVWTDQEAGLLGVAIDPDYANSRYLYVFYSTASDQRLVRLRANSAFSAAEAGSATVLLSGLPRASNIHKGGDIHFSPADPTAIYIALGDDGVRSTRITCISRESLQIAVPQCPDRYEGKLLKVDAGNGRGLPSNPFYNGDPNSIASRVWAVGFRNPFRFTFHRGRPDTDVLYVSENGDGVDRISRVRVGSNGGWGPCGDAGACNGPGDVNDGGPFVAPKDPNHKVMLTINPSLVGIEIASGGPFGTDVLYFARYGASVRRGQLTGANLDSLQTLDNDGAFASVSAVTLRFGPDGHLYFASSGQGASTGGNDPLRRLRFNATTPPTAAFTTAPNPPVGLAPLNVQFTDQSTAPGSSIAQRSWVFGDGATSTSTSPARTYTTPGRYTARLTVTNAAGQQASTTREVVVNRAVNLQINGSLRDARTLAAPPLGVATELRLYQDDGVTPAPHAGGSNVITVAAGGVVSAQVQVDLSGNAIVISAGEPAGDGVQPVRRGFVLPAGAGPYTLAMDAWLSDTTVAGRVLDTRGVPLVTDVGLRRAGAPYALPNGRDYLPGSGITATGVAHRVMSDALGWFHMPVRSDGAGALRVDAAADTATATHANPMLDRSITLGSLLSLNVQVGIWNGGRDCTNLSAIPTTPTVDFAGEIQPIFNAACIGCHAPGATNSGGLDLTAPASLAALVNALSDRAPGVRRVLPGEPSRSFLFEKINCADPQNGTRMRPGDPMPALEQALFRDWILQQLNPDQVFADGFES